MGSSYTSLGSVRFASGGPDDGLVATEPRVLHWDGVRWQDTAIPGPVHAVYCVAADDVWAVGDLGAIYRFDGVGWTGGATTEGIFTAFEHIAVRGDTVLIVGEANTLEYRDGTYTVFDTVLEVRDLTSDGTRFLAATNEGVQSWSAGWVLEDAGSFSFPDARNIAAAGPNSVLAFFWADRGAGPPWFARFFDGSTWHIRDMPGACGILGDNEVSGLAALNEREYWAGQWGVPPEGAYECTLTSSADIPSGTEFEDRTEQPLGDDFGDFPRRNIFAGPDTWLFYESEGVMQVGDAIPVTPPSPLMGTSELRYADPDVFWVTNGLGGTARWSAGAWTQHPVTPGVGFSDFAFDTDRAWGVSEGTHTGGLYRWTESLGWERVRESGIVAVDADFGDVWVERDDGTIERLDGDTWTPARYLDGPLHLHAAAGDGRVWALDEREGDGVRAIYRWDGSWTRYPVPSPTSRSHWIVGARGDEAWAEGHRLVGETWQPYLTGMHHHVARVHIDHRQVWIVGFDSGFAVRKNL